MKKITVILIGLAIALPQMAMATPSKIHLKFDKNQCAIYQGNLSQGKTLIFNAHDGVFVRVKNLGKVSINHAPYITHIASNTRIDGIPQDGTGYRGVQTTMGYFPDDFGKHELYLTSHSNNSKVRVCLVGY